MIRIEHLTKIYLSGTNDKKILALNDINLTIKDGCIFGIIGLSGAGKSSLVRCINRLEEPTEGKILINDIDITSLKKAGLREMRKKIGMIFQHFNLLSNSTVYENIAFPLKISSYPKDKIKDRVNELLSLTELEDKSSSYPSQLSGGQKQRVGIARALANNPKLLLSDEATSALDPKTTQSILKLLKDINKKFGITIIVITHEMDVIKEICDEVAVLEDGSIIEQGNVVDIFSNPVTETAKSFIEDMSSSLPNNVDINDKPEEEVVKLRFQGNVTKEPVISRLIKKYDIDVNILVGNVDNIQGISVGNLLIKITGKPGDVKSSIKYLNDLGLQVEVLKNDR